jgi:hypothetical protein
MTRRYSLYLALAAAAACGRPQRTGDSLLPSVVGGVWRRQSLTQIRVPPSAAGSLREFEANYAGPGNVTADIYQAKVSAVAFEMAQKWKPAANTVSFYKDEYFAVIKWDRADRQALTAFVGALEKVLGPEKAR